MWSSKTARSKDCFTLWVGTHQSKIFDLRHSLIETATDRSSLKISPCLITLILLLQSILPLKNSWEKVCPNYRDLRKIRNAKKSDPHRYMRSGSKSHKKKFSLHFYPIVRVWVLRNGLEYTPLQHLYLFESNFSGIQFVWIDKLHHCDERA